MRSVYTELIDLSINYILILNYLIQIVCLSYLEVRYLLFKIEFDKISVLYAGCLQYQHTVAVLVTHVGKYLLSKHAAFSIEYTIARSTQRLR